MSRKPKTVLYRRKREKRTNYHKRLKQLLSRKPRVVVRLTNSKIIAQIVEYAPQGDRILAALDSSLLKKRGWKFSCKNIPAAYLTGYLLGKEASGKCQEAVLDTGFNRGQKKGRIYAFLKGLLDAGMNIPHGGEDIFPDEERIRGKHLKTDAGQELEAQFDKIKQE